MQEAEAAARRAEQEEAARQARAQQQEEERARTRAEQAQREERQARDELIENVEVRTWGGPFLRSSRQVEVLRNVKTRGDVPVGVIGFQQLKLLKASVERSSWGAVRNALRE